MSKNCIHCGAQLHIDADFCHSCARSQIEKAKPKIPRPGRRKAALCVFAGVVVVAALLLTAFGRSGESGPVLNPGEALVPELSGEISGPVMPSGSEPNDEPSNPAVTEEPAPDEEVPNPPVTEEPEPTPDEEIPVEAGHYFTAFSGTEDYVRRKLSDYQLWQLRDADVFVLQESISTVADAVAYLDQFPHGRNSFFDAIDSDFIVDIAFMVDLHRTEATGPDVYTAFTGWCLADDYPTSRYLIASGTCPEFTWIYHGLLLPGETGFRVITPAGHSKYWNCVFGFEEVSVSTSEGIEAHLIPIHAGMEDDSGMFLYHLFATVVGPDKLNFWMDDNYLITTAAAEELYRKPEDTNP